MRDWASAIALRGISPAVGITNSSAFIEILRHWINAESNQHPCPGWAMATDASDAADEPVSLTAPKDTTQIEGAMIAIESHSCRLPAFYTASKGCVSMEMEYVFHRQDWVPLRVVIGQYDDARTRRSAESNCKVMLVPLFYSQS